MDKTALCPQCHKLVNFLLYDNQVEINCRCSFYSILSIKDFVLSIQTYNGPKYEMITICPQHNIIYSFYCWSCDAYLCSECSHNHFDFHGLEKLNRYLPQKNKDKIIQEFTDLQKGKYKDNPDIKFIYDVLLKTNEQYPLNVIAMDNLANNTSVDFYSSNKTKHKKLNLDNGHFSLFKIQKSKLVKSIFFLKDKRLAYSSSSSIIIANPLSLEPFFTIKHAHSQGVSCISQLKDETIITNSLNEVKHWKLYENTYDLLGRVCHLRVDFMYNTVVLSDNKIAISAGDVFIYDTNPYKELSVLSINTGKDLVNDIVHHVTSLVFYEEFDMLVSCSDNNFVHFWNTKSYTEIEKINFEQCQEEKEMAYDMIKLQNNKIAVLFSFHVLIVNIKSYQIESIIKWKDGLQFGFHSFGLWKNKYIICGNLGLIGFDIKTLKGQILMEQIHDQAIFRIVDGGNEILYTSSADSTIKLWKEK